MQQAKEDHLRCFDRLRGEAELYVTGSMSTYLLLRVM